jgi:hypothetical protein
MNNAGRRLLYRRVIQGNIIGPIKDMIAGRAGSCFRA